MRPSSSSLYLILFFVCIGHAEPVTIHVADRHYFPACKKHSSVRPYLPPICLRSSMRRTGDFNDIVESVGQKEIAKLAEPQATAVIDQAIEAREKIVRCFESKDLACGDMIEKFKAIVDRRITAIRRALMLAQSAPGDIDPINPSSSDLQMNMPQFVGGKVLSPPTTEEYKSVEAIREMAKATYDIGFVNDEKGKPIGHDRSLTYCETRQTKECVQLWKDHNSIPDDIKKNAALVADRLVQEMPFIADFDRAPVRREELKAAVVKSKTALEAWRKEMTDPKDFDNFVYHYPQYIEPLLEKRPDLCRAAETAFARAKGWDHFTTIGSWLVKGGVTLTACLASGGVACAPVGLGMAILDGRGNYSEEVQLEERMAALGDDRLLRTNALDAYRSKQDQLIKPEDVINARRDFLTGLAFDLIASVPAAKAVGRAISKSVNRTVVHEAERVDVGNTVEVLVPEEGSMALEGGKQIAQFVRSNTEETVGQAVSHTGPVRVQTTPMDDFFYRVLMLPAAP